ncbi:hypothetical protein [Dyella monticola]|uniref:hypothetical protein n=1 Tax=Dyella monticola TaxID=1927958 RepID=UPI0011C040CA|nr:hypothetical protein [Dyella monticola]
MREEWIKNSQDIAGHKRAFRNSHKVFSVVLRMLHESGWCGACHASSAITHIALQELGVDNVLVLGEAVIGPAYFDHSWIEVQSKPIDSAISIPLNRELSANPVFLGMDVDTKLPTKVIYRASTSVLDDDAKLVADNDLGWYFENFNFNSSGFFEPLMMVVRDLGIRKSEEEICRKYSSVRWTRKT